jgi:hypothetical protein
MTKTLHRYGLTLELDTDEICEDDPGAGTPAMVYTKDERGRTVAATYYTAVAMGEVEHVQLRDQQVSWLESQEGVVERFLTRGLMEAPE